ncbi:unnamed protein product, partial [Scytosiphon promiscuus]
QELERTQPSALCGPDRLLLLDAEECDAGKLCFPGEGREHSDEGGRACHPLLRTSPLPPTLLEANLLKVNSTSCHHVALTAEGDLITWTYKRARAAGIAAATSAPLSVTDRPPSVHVWRPRARRSADFVTGTGGSFGCAEIGDLGSPCVWQLLADKPNVKDIACGEEHTLALLETGQVFSWGSGRNGRLGLEDGLDRTSAYHVRALEGIEIEAVSCGVAHSLAICSKGTCYAWGNNNRGQCGDAETLSSDVLSPRAVEGLKNAPVATIVGGREHTLALTCCGILFSFGGGLKSGGDMPAVLGISATAAADSTEVTLGKHGGISPTRVCGDAMGTTRIKMIASGWDHCLAVTGNGELFTWGSGRDGQLGHGDTEPRHIPTLVDLFATPAGGRVRSAGGGRSYSAAVTTDGHVFRWGLNRKPKSLIQEEHDYHNTVVGACGRRNSCIGEDGAVTVEASVPQRVPGTGVEGSRVIRLGEGEIFGFVLLELRSGLGRQPLPPGGNQDIAPSNVSKQGLVASAGSNVPEDPSQPVGRIKTATVLLRHIERLAAPHTPTDFALDIERSVSQVVRVGKRIQKQLLRAEWMASGSPKSCPDFSTTSSVDHPQFPMRAETDVPGDDNIDPEKYAPICSVGKLHGHQEALAVLSRTPSPVVPFCVDPSRRTFRSFLDLIQGIRAMKRIDHVIPARNDIGIDAPESSGAPDEKGTSTTRSMTDNNGPENCEGPMSPTFEKSATADKPSDRRQRATLAAPASGEIVAPRSVQMDVLRGVLKMLKVNLFHLVRVAAGRHACRESGFGHPCEKGALADEPGPSCETRSKDRVANPLSTVIHGKTPSTSDQGQCQRRSDCAESVRSLMGELHTELRDLLEEDIAQEERQTTDAALAVKMEAAEAFRVGFGLFFPSNLARVRLLLEIAKATKTTDSLPLELKGEDLHDTEELRQCDEHIHTRALHVPKGSSLMVRLEVEGLARKDYAAALVHEAFNDIGSAGKAGEEDGTEEGEPRDEIGEACEIFDATKLDAVMQSLLSCCADNLHARLWGGTSASTNAATCRKVRPRFAIPLREEHAAGCPHSSLLLVLQEHVVACWGNTDGSDDRKAAARGLTLAHTLRLLGESLRVFTRLLEDGEQRVGYKYTQENLTTSFMSLLPVLCVSWVALPSEEEGFLWRAAALLPVVVPLTKAVDIYNRHRAPAVEAVPDVRDNLASSWLIDFEEAVAMLCSDLICGVIDGKPSKVPHLVKLSSNKNGGDDSLGGGTRNRSGQRDEDDIAELLIASSPFCSFGHEGFDWSGIEDAGASKPDRHDFSHALKVIAFQENITPETCGCSSQAGPTSAAPPSIYGASNPQHSLARRGRRVSQDDAAKLSPAGANIFPYKIPGRELQSKTATANQGSNMGARGAAVGKASRDGGTTGRQLHSIVDEAYAEDFIQDLLCGQGVAAALYRWMTVPSEPQLPVLHAASLATQGQGWGSYQSLGSHAKSGQHETDAGQRRRRSRALPSDVDAATRAIVAVMIKSNGVVAEAATFAKQVEDDGHVSACRLDRSSSPPRALKLVAEAAAEVREVLAELNDSLGGNIGAEERESTERHHDHQCQNRGARGLHREHDPSHDSKDAAAVVQPAGATLANIVRKCRLLLTCTTRLPSVELTRKSCQKDTSNCRRDRSYSRLPADNRQTRQELSLVFKRWAVDAANISSSRPHCRPTDESTASRLAHILQHIVQGRVDKALLATAAVERSYRDSGMTSLESLVVFAANPIPLEALQKNMRHHRLGATARASGFRLLHSIINDVHDPAARRQISTRLARSLGGFEREGDNPALFDSIGAGGHAAVCGVRAAYLDIFRHVLYEVEQEHSRLKPLDDINRTSSSSLLLLLSLLKTLTTLLTPAFLGHASSTPPFEERLAPSLASANSGSSSPRPEPAAPKSGLLENCERPTRAARSSSCPSIDLGKTSGSRSFHQSSQESISPLTTAIRVLGLILCGHGDLLTSQACMKETTTVHHAAWQALGMAGLQLCSSAPAKATSKCSGNGSFESEQSVTRRPSPNSESLEGQSFALEWWAAVQEILVILFGELVRARQYLEQLHQRTRAREEILTATAAARLITGPVPLPLPAKGDFSDGGEKEKKDAHAVSFWIWRPAQPVLSKPVPGSNIPRADCSARARGDALGYIRERTIFTRFGKASLHDEATEKPGRCMAIFLSRPPPSDETEQHGSTAVDTGGYYVGTYLGRKSFPGRPTEHKKFPRDEEKGNGHGSTTSDTNAVSDGQDEELEILEGGQGCISQASQTDSVFSKCPLRPGQWTHVCCRYADSRDGGDGARSVGAHTRADDAALYTDVTIAFNGTIVASHTLPAFEGGSRSGRLTEQSHLDERCKFQVDVNRNYASLRPDLIHFWSSERDCGSAVCDIYFHGLDVSQEQASQMASEGIPAEDEEKKRTAETYLTRLVALAENLTACSRRVATTMSSARWLSLWFQLIAVAGDHAKRTIVRLLRPLLCTRSQTIGDGLEGGAALKVGSDSLHAPSSDESGFGDCQIVDRLCGLLGGLLVPLLSCRSSDRIVVGGSQNVSERKSVPLLQDSCMLSEIVFLLRSLLKEAPDRWREHVFTVLTDGLTTAAEGSLPAIQEPTGANDENVAAWEKRQSTWLGAATTAAYLGGGLIEGPRLGARVMLLPDPGHEHVVTSADAEQRHCGERLIRSGEALLRDVVGTVCMPADTQVLDEGAVKDVCHGTVVGWMQDGREITSPQGGFTFVAIDEQCKDGIDGLQDNDPAAQGISLEAVSNRSSFEDPWCRVVPVRRQATLSEEVAETLSPYLFQAALPSMLALLDSPPIPTGRNILYTRDEKGSGGKPPSEMECNLISAHLRCRLFRALAAQVRHVGQADAAVRGKVLRPLLAHGGSTLASVIVLALGSDGAVAFGRRRDFAAVVLSFRCHGPASDHSLRLELESACQIVWDRLVRGANAREEHRPRSTSQPVSTARDERVDVCRASHPRPTLQVLGGDALVEGNRVTASSHFPTIRLSDVGVASGLLRERWYYEVTLMTGGLMQLGWAGPSFRCSPTSGQGVGDAEGSWAFDGFRQKRWCVASAPYGKRWRAGDVIGVLLDAGLQEMRFSLNGGDLGVAFVGFDVKGLYPAASMNVGQAAHFNFGQCPFLFAPTDDGRLLVQPISEAVCTTATAEHTSTNSARLRAHSMFDVRRYVGEDGVEADCTNDNAEADDDAHARDGNGDVEDREEDRNQLEVERQALVENMIGMGFPVEWAIRSAGRSGAVMSESAATAWIIERLEVENTKMEQEMGNMDTCEEDSADGNSGVRDEYNDVGGSEDGDPDTFAFNTEAAEVGRLTPDDPDRVDEESGDRRWHDMYSAVRRSFLTRGNGESPATTPIRPGQFGSDLSATTGLATKAGRTGSDSATYSTTASRLRGTEGVEPVERSRDDSCRLTRIAMSADEVDLLSLSLVFETALSILLARSAVVSLLIHAADGSAPVPDCWPYVVAQVGTKSTSNIRPSAWLDPPITKGQGMHDPAVTEALRPSSAHSPWDGDWQGAEVARDVAYNLLEELTIPENQQRIVDLTKACSIWHLPSRSTISAKDVGSAGKGIAAVIERNGPLDYSKSGNYSCFAGAVDPMGLSPASYLAAMRSLFDLIVAPVKHSTQWLAVWRESSARRTKEGDSLPSELQIGDDAVSGSARIGSLARLVRLFVHEAIATFETDRVLKCAESGTNALTAAAALSEGRTHFSACGPLASRPNHSWALWVLGTLLELETEVVQAEERMFQSLSNGSAVTGSVWTARRKDGDTGDGENPVLQALAYSRSSEAFSTLLRSAAANNTGELLQSLAFSLCSHMLNASRLAPLKAFKSATLGLDDIQASTADSKKGKAHEHPTVAEAGKKAFRTEELSLARAFSVRLRNQISLPSFSSKLLQSQLELLAQFELKRSAVCGKLALEADRTRRLREVELDRGEGNVKVEKPQSPQVLANTTRQYADNWDVATALCAGIEEGSDEFETTRAGKFPVAGRGRRTGTAESEGSALSCLPTPRFLEKLSPPHHSSLLVEAVSATSVTVSWGGWFEPGDEPELQVGARGDGLAYPVAFGKVAGASGLAQALRSKLKHASSRRRNEGPSLILKVCACGLWGSEPFHVAALDLDVRGCLTVNGLAADTRYTFRLERHEASPSRAPPSAAADLSDDENSCFPSVATVGANSAGGSSADQHAADVTDCASALTGLDGSGGEGGGGASTCSEGCITVLTDESRRHGGQASCCTSSTRAVAGRYLSPSSGDRYANKHTIDQDELHWPAMGGRDRSCGAPENLVMGRADGAIVASVSVATPPEVPFMLDAEGCGPNLRLTNSNLTVVNVGRKKWGAVRATKGFTRGVHRWQVRIDRCVSKNVFVGVMASDSRLDNYVGSDRSGWGYLANKAIWHDKGKVRSYGDLFREGDTIGVKLDMDLGTLRFSRNGRDLGLAVQGLEGALFPAFSMYNRSDQLTFLPQDDDATPSHRTSPDGAVDDENGMNAPRVGGRPKAENTSCNIIYGAFSAECVIRRAAKALEVLGILHDPSRSAGSAASGELVENICSRLREWSRGEHGRSVPSARSCAPVRLDTSEQARQDLFGLGVGDRVLSAEGEATVLGATKHSLWVELEPASSSSATSEGFSQASRAWDSETARRGRKDASKGNPGHTASVAEATTMLSPPHRRLVGRRGSRIMPWSRCTVRRIFNNPEDYVVSRHETSTASEGRFPPAADVDGRDNLGQNETEGIAAGTVDHLRIDEVQDLFLRWTPRMDEELEHHLTKLADSMAIASPLDLTFDALSKMPLSTSSFPDASPVALAEVWARVALLLYVNDLVLPLLPLVDTSSDDRGPLSALIHKCRHMLFQAAKLSLLDSANRQKKARVPSEPGTANAPAPTIRVAGVKVLPTVPAAPLTPTTPLSQSWAQTWRAVEKSVFGQVARHLSCSPKRMVSEGPMAFLVELVDAAIVTDAEGAAGGNLQLADARALYRGVFWQVCVDVCSSPISMFVRSQAQAVSGWSSVAPDPVATNIDSDKEANDSLVEDHKAVPNPLFASNGVAVDPGRLSLYRSLGFIAGIAVRTGVPLPLSHLSPRWWMLVSSDASSSPESPTAVGGGPASGTKTKADARGRSRSVHPDGSMPSDAAKDHLPFCTVDEVLTKLSRLEEAGIKKKELDEVLADARFVAPLSNGLVAELQPGGLKRPVTQRNLGEYRRRLARLQASESAPQASAFRAGLEAALPKRMLSLLTWRQMEELICG